MRTYLNNPTKVKDAYIAEPVLRPVGGKFRITSPACVTIRGIPRTSTRAIKPVWRFFLGGKLSQFVPGTPEMCGGLAYMRYPEIESMVP